MQKKADRNSKFNNKKELNLEAQDEFKKIQDLKKQKTIFKKSDFDKCGIELTPKQHELYKTIRSNTLTVVQGPAGTAKTFVACYTALGLLADGKVSKIIITKPIVEAGEGIGFLPGTAAEKTQPFMKSYISTFEKILGKFLSDALISAGVIEVNLLAYMRGDTFDDSVMILDEAQNVLISQLMLWATRMGKGSYSVLCGDVSQYDIKQRDAKFLQFIEFTKGMKDVANFKFERKDIVRNKFLIELTDRYEKWKYKDDNTNNNNTMIKS
jgi:phosphate starvation-inducible PhoH-like protein